LGGGDVDLEESCSLDPSCDFEAELLGLEGVEESLVAFDGDDAAGDELDEDCPCAQRTGDKITNRQKLRQQSIELFYSVANCCLNADWKFQRSATAASAIKKAAHF
jgi:hypothetical protein